MNCNHCGAPLQNGELVCHICGSTQRKVCSCGSINPVDAKFCQTCCKPFGSESTTQTLTPGEEYLNEDHPSQQQSEFGGGLIATILTNAFMLMIFLMLHFSMKEMEETKSVIETIQWVRYLTVIFAFIDFTAIVLT